MTSLDRLPVGARGRVRTVRGQSALIQRLGELGVFEGEVLELLGVAPLGDPIEIRVGESRLSLRREEAAGIELDLLI
jgi:ferrous iron transport protein A